MPFITLATAKMHSRIDDTYSDADLTIKIAAAERAAIEYLQCNVYADQAALNTAIAAVPASLSAAKAAYIIADAAVDALTDIDLSLMERAYAMTAYMRVVYAATRTRQGVVINDLIIAAMLLTLGWLYEVREDGDTCPRAAQDLLNPFRCYA